MHSAVLVIVPQDGFVADALAPFRDVEFDYYVIGGRFTGLFDGYDPRQDSDNYETCVLCNGTGRRLELPSPIQTSTLEAGQWIRQMDYSRTTREYMESLGGCNGCEGKGIHLKPSSDWKPYERDSILVSELTAEQYEGKFYAVCIRGMDWYSSERHIPWAPEDKRVQPLELPPLQWLKSICWEGDRAVVVDCHS
jgi:hypothetical protein